MTRIDAQESQEQLDAFEIWFNGGEPLSFSKLSETLRSHGVPRSSVTLRKWRDRFKWEERRDRRLADLKSKLDESVVDDLERQKKQMIAVVDLALVRIQQALVGGNVTCTACGAVGVCSECGKPIAAAKISLTVRDIEKLVNAKLKLIGEPNERVDVTSGGGTLLDLVKLALEQE